MFALREEITLSEKDKIEIKAILLIDPDQIEDIAETVAAGIVERIDRGGLLKAQVSDEEIISPPKILIVGHKIIVPRLNGFAPIAEKVAQFARLEEASSDVAVYRVTRLSLWKGAQFGITPDEAIEVLKTHSPTPPIRSFRNYISRTMSVYGSLTIRGEKNYNVLHAIDEQTLNRILAYRDVKALIYRVLDGTRARITQGRRADIKRLLLEKGFPVKDYGLMEEFTPLKISWRPDAQSLWDHQKDAITRFIEAQNGVVILPPGAGKTRVAVGATVELQASTLFISNKGQVCEQVREEYLKQTTLQAHQISVIHGGSGTRYINKVTITTYQMLAASLRGKGSRLVNDIWKTKWGIIVFDEVQHVPANLWSQVAAKLQGIRKLGLTATLVREDKKEKEIFSLIGPPVIDINWLEMADEGRISSVTAFEVLISMSQNTRTLYNRAHNAFQKIIVATTNPKKLGIIKQLLEKHKGQPTLVIGYYVEHAIQLAEKLNAPYITGTTPQGQRKKIYQSFRDGEIPVLVLTSVGEEGIDLPNAEIGISVASLYGSRMGFSQKFGRILRVQEGKEATFYELVTEGTAEQDFSERRRQHLIGQGYDFDTIDMTGVS